MDNLLKMCKKENIDIEILEKNEKQMEFRLLNGIFKENILSNHSTYQLRAIYQGKLITLEVDDICDSEKIIHLIKENYRILDNNISGTLAVPTDIDVPEKKQKVLDYKKIKEQFLSLMKIKEAYCNISSLDVQFCYQYETITLTNSNRVHLKESNNFIVYYIETVAKEKSQVESSSVYRVESSYDFDKIQKDTHHVMKEATEKLTGIACQTKKSEVILTNECMAKFLQHLADMFFAKTINQKTSLLTNDYQKKVFSDKLTIVEEPTKKDMIISRHFDDEGTKTFSKTIIDQGVFQTKLYNNQEAEKDKTVSTGNSYGVRNMYLKAGKKDFVTLLKEMDEGIVITELVNLSAGIDKITGHISVPVVGYFVKNGEKNKMLKQFILSTDVKELLNQVKEVGSDLKIINSRGGSPSVWFHDITVVGDEDE